MRKIKRSISKMSNDMLFLERELQLNYEGNGYFTVLRRRDEKVFVKRERLTFIPERKA